MLRGDYILCNMTANSALKSVRYFGWTMVHGDLASYTHLKLLVRKTMDWLQQEHLYD
jgi:hypothetical protein